MLLTTPLNGISYERLFLAADFYLADNQVLHVLIGCNRQLLLIKVYAGISNIFKIVHHLLKLRASNKGIKQMLFLLFSNFLSQKRKQAESYTASSVYIHVIISLTFPMVNLWLTSSYLPTCWQSISHATYASWCWFK